MNLLRVHVAAVCFAAVAVSACSFEGLAFVQDRRLEFVAPEDRQIVRLPVTIDWEFEGLDIVGDETSGDDPARIAAFGVFLDGRPQPPGELLSWHAKDDDTCQRIPSCPDEEWYRLRGIHTTTDTSFTIEQLPRPSGDDGRRELHTITVILLNHAGARIGESAWQLEIEIDRTTP